MALNDIALLVLSRPNSYDFIPIALLEKYSGMGFV